MIINHTVVSLSVNYAVLQNIKSHFVNLYIGMQAKDLMKNNHVIKRGTTMTDKHTSIHLPNDNGNGLMDWGYLTREQMISTLRGMAKRNKEKAEAILNAKDSDFIVEQHTGVYRRKNIVEIKP